MTFNQTNATLTTLDGNGFYRLTLMVLMVFHLKVSPFTADCNRLSVFHMRSPLTDDDDISITAQRKVLDCIFKGYSQWVKDLS